MRVVFAFVCALLLATGARAQKTVTDGIAVIVNDSVITYQDVEQHIGSFVQLLVSQYMRQPDVLRQKISEARADGTEQLVDRKLILHEYKTAGYSYPETVIEDEIQRRIKEKFRDRATLLQGLREQGMTYAMWSEQQREDIIIYAMQSLKVPRDVLISPQKILSFYQTNQTNFAVPEQVKLRTIVLNKPPTDKGGVKQLAEEIVRKMNEGASFEEMAKIHSDAPQRTTAEWASREVLRKELADVAFSLEPGQRSGVVDLPDACWILMLDDKRPAHIRPLSEVRDEIERTLRLTETARIQRKWLSRLKEKAFVRYF